MSKQTQIYSPGHFNLVTHKLIQIYTLTNKKRKLLLWHVVPTEITGLVYCDIYSAITCCTIPYYSKTSKQVKYAFT